MGLSEIAKGCLVIINNRTLKDVAVMGFRFAHDKKTDALSYNIIPAGHFHPKIHRHGYIRCVGENEGTFTEPASSSEILCNWHPMVSSESRVVATKDGGSYHPAPLYKCQLGNAEHVGECVGESLPVS